MENFKKFIKKYIELPETDWQLISSVIEKQSFEKNTLIIEYGKVCDYFYFIEEGLLRSYTLQNNNDITKFFIPAPYCMTSRYSFLNETPAEENIETLEKTLVWRIHRDDYKKLIELNSWQNLIRKLLNEIQDYTEQRLISSLNETAESRYSKMLEEIPDIIHRIPLKYLASYLGIASQSLSRIRKSALKNKE